MLQEEAIDYFQRLHKKGEHLCVIVWQADDVIGQAHEAGVKCSKEEADKILEAMEHQHNASFGISWSTIDSHLDDLVTERMAKKKELKAKEKVQID
jgi:hypothetical protein